MSQRRRLVVGLTLVFIVAGLGYWRFAPGPRLRSENFADVRVGLTQVEVENLLGGPPGNYGRYSGGGMMTLEGFLAPAGAVEKIWCDDSNRFEIYFDSQDRVVAFHKRASYQQSPPDFGAVWRRIARWFGL